MKNLQWWLIAFLTLVIVLLLLFQPQPTEPDNQAFKDQINSLNTKLAQKDADAQALLTRIKLDSTKHADTTRLLSSEIKGLKSRLRNQRVKIDTLIIENPELARYVEISDSVIASQGEQIELQGRYIAELQTDVNKLTDNFHERLAIYEQKYALLDSRVKDQQKQIRKERRIGRVFKVLSVVGLVGGILLGGQ